MQGVDYAIRTAQELQMPVVINLSFGNSYGSHDGTSLVETYLNQAVGYGRVTLCVGTGNEGNQAGHAAGRVRQGENYEVELGIGPYEPAMNLQIWKDFSDQMELSLVHPDGTVFGPLEQILGTQRYRYAGTELLIYYGKPSPYSTSQEIYIDFLPIESYIDSGIWRIRLIPRRILQGEFSMWLPGGKTVGEATRFYRPTPETTLTIPSTALSAISVAAYDSRRQSYADFSGRGYTRLPLQIKPDLAAAGMKLTYTNVNGYLIPNLTYKSGEQMEQLGKYGFLTQRLSEEPSKFNVSGDAFAGYDWRASSGSGQGSQRTGRSDSETVGRKRTTAG